MKVNGLQAERTRVTLLVVSRGGEQAQLTVTAPDGSEVAKRELAGAAWRRTQFGEAPEGQHDWTEMRWSKPVIDGLAPDTRYRVSVEGGGARAACVVTTLPARDAGTVRLTVASCFDVKGKQRTLAEMAHGLVVPVEDDDKARLNIWLGDQVYVDAPWYHSTTTGHSRSVIFDRYLESWGHVNDDAGLAHVLRQGSNWFLPDDHEFWNGYPHPGWATLFRHTLKRMLVQLVRLPRNAPPHPVAQGDWGRAAGEAYALFCSNEDFQDFTEEVSPTQLQRLETEGLCMVLVDTRWHRTIRKRGRGAGFMRTEDLGDLVDLLSREERIVCLGFSKPLIGHLPHRGATRRIVMEYGPEDYPTQYNRLWRALEDRAKAGRPTIILGGDVHHHTISSAYGGRLLEIVSSPSGLLDALDDESKLMKAASAAKAVTGFVRRGWKGLKGVLRTTEERVRPNLRVDAADWADELLFPEYGPTGDWEAAVGERHYTGPDRASGLASIDVTSDGDVRRVVVRHAVGYAHRLDNGKVATSMEPVDTQTFEWDVHREDGPRWVLAR